MGQIEKAPRAEAPAYDPECYLCPGNHRAHGAVNPHYRQTFVFDNDFPALQPEAGGEKLDRDGLMVAEAEPGICRVICFSPRHDLTLARMTVEDIERVVGVWGEQYRALGAFDGINAVQIFENRGDMMGASNPHPALPGVGDRHAAQRDGQGARRAVRLLARARFASCFSTI